MLNASYHPTAALATGDQAGQLASVLAFLAFLYGDRSGYAELSTIEGDPRRGCGGIFHKIGYYAMPRQSADLARDVISYGALHGNVYLSSTLYDDRSRKHPLPSPVVFLDDAPETPALPYSGAVQTSAASRHGYYLADRPLENDERRDLQQRRRPATDRARPR
jgi:hypothetical protein